MELKLPTIDVYVCLLHKNGQPKRYLPDPFFTRNEANLWAKEYLNNRQKKKLSIKVQKLGVSHENLTTEC
jgi:hypothetical protein